MFAGPTGPDGLHVPSFVEGDCCRSNTAQADPGVAGPEAFAALTFSLIAVGGLTVVLLRHRASAAQAAAGDLAPRRGGFGCRIVKSSRLRGRNLTRARQVAASATRAGQRTGYTPAHPRRRTRAGLPGSAWGQPRRLAAVLATPTGRLLRLGSARPGFGHDDGGFWTGRAGRVVGQVGGGRESCQAEDANRGGICIGAGDHHRRWALLDKHCGAKCAHGCRTAHP